MANERKPAVLLWNWGRRGGGPRYTLHLAQALAARSDVRLHLSYSAQAELAGQFRALSADGLMVSTYSGPVQAVWRSLQLPLIGQRLAHYVVQERIDLVISTMHHLWTRYCFARLGRTSARRIAVIHDGVPHPGDAGWIQDYLFAPPPGADRYIALTRHVADQLIRVHGISSSRIAVIPHGQFAFDGLNPQPRAIRTDGPLHIHFFGRLTPYKGLPLLVEACETLHKASIDMTLTVTGHGPLETVAGRLGQLPNAVVHNRWIDEDEIPTLLQRADVVVLPYTEASQSGVAAVAFGMGIPVVVTPVGGLTEQVTDGHNGLVAADVTAEALADCLSRLASAPDLVVRLSQGAVATAASQMNWDKIAGRFLAEGGIA